MASVLYAISFKKTGNLLALMSLERPATTDQLFKDLVGDKLVLSVGPGAKIVLQPNDVAIDELTDDVKVNDVLPEIYSYRLDLSDPNSAAGDGTPKALTKANTYQVKSLQIALAAANVVVTFTTSEGTIPHDAYLLFEGCDPAQGFTTATSPTVTLAIDSSVTLNATTSYAFAFIKSDAPITFGFLQPT